MEILDTTSRECSSGSIINHTAFVPLKHEGLSISLLFITTHFKSGFRLNWWGNKAVVFPMLLPAHSCHGMNQVRREEGVVGGGWVGRNALKSHVVLVT